MNISRDKRPVLIAMLTLLVTFAPVDNADTVIGPLCISEIKLTASDGAAGDWLGWGLAISGNTIVAGASGDDDDSNGMDSGSAYVYRLNGTTWEEEAKLIASDGAAGDNFGWAAAISGNAIVVGAPYDDDNGVDSGSAYVFRFDGTSWVEEAKLTASDGAAGEWFGQYLGMSGDTIVVGNPREAAMSGSAYVFRFKGTSWNEEAKLTASDGAAGDYFGESIATGGELILVGAWGDDGKGSAYVFRFNGLSWVEEDKLTPGDGAADDWFGWGTAISDDKAVIGAAANDDTGSAYVFRFNGTTWEEEAKLTAGDGAAGDEFGYPVAISGDTVLFGARSDEDFGMYSGSAYVFRFNGTSWEEEGKLTAYDGAADDRFSEDGVAISGNVAVVGAWRDDDNGELSGSIYVFTLPSEIKLTASDGEAGDWLGWGLSISGNTIVAGASGDDDDDNGVNSGSAYVYRHNGNTWEEEAKLIASDGAAGDNFGWAAAISGDAIVVGAPYDDDYDGESGSAYVFRFDGTSWVEEDKLTASGGAAGDEFGKYLGMSGDTIVVGNPREAAMSGSAYVFRFKGTSWNEEAKLTASDGAANDYFGESVAIGDDLILVGAWGDDGKGSAYVFRFNGLSWVEEDKLTPGDGAAGDWFGWGTAISDDKAVIGAAGDDDNGLVNSGSAYVFRFDGATWEEEAKLTAGDGDEGDEFGYPAAISGDTVLFGARSDEDFGVYSGSAYAFRFNGTSWEEEAKLTACDGAADDRFSEDGVAISGNVVVVGAWRDDDKGELSGSIYVFTLPIELELDVNPGGDPNSVDCTNVNAVITIAILTTDDFDASTVDHTTVTFEGAGEMHVDKRDYAPRLHKEDVDGDGDIDLVFHFRLADTELTCDSTEGTLTGETFEGQIILGTDSIRMIK